MTLILSLRRLFTLSLASAETNPQSLFTDL